MELGFSPVDVMRGAMGGATGRVAPRPNGSRGRPTEAPAVEQLMAQGTPSAAETVLTKAESTGWNLINLEFFPMIAAGVLGAVVKAGDWMRSKTGWGVASTEKPGLLTKTANLLRLPSRFMGQTTLGDLASPKGLLNNAVETWKNRAMGSEAHEAARAAQALTTARTPAMAMVGETMATRVGNVVQGVVHRVNRLPGQPLSWFERLCRDRANGFIAHKAVPALSQLENLVLTSGSSIPASHAARLSDSVRALTPLVGTAGHGLASANIKHKVGELRAAVQELSEHVAGIKNPSPSLTATVNALQSRAATVAKATGKAESWFTRATGWQNLGTSIAKMPEALKKVPLSQGLMAGAFVAMGAAAAAKTLRQRHEDKIGVANLASDLQGLPDTPLSREMREVISHANKASGRYAMLNGAINAASTGLSLRMLKGGGLMAMVPVIGVQMLGTTASEIVFPRNSFPHVYHALSEAHAKGQKLTTAHYASLLGMALPNHLKDVSMDGALMQAVCQQYMDGNFSPKQLLQDVAMGGLDTRAAAIKQQMSAPKAPAPASTAVAPAAAEPKPVVGKFTQAVTGQAPTVVVAKPAPATVTAMPDASAAIPTAQVGAMLHEGRLGQAAAVAVGS